MALMGLWASCHQNNSQPVSSIAGLMDTEGKTHVRLSELDARSLIPLDSVVTGSDGSFIFALRLSEPSFYQLSTPQSDPLTLIVKPGDNITIEGKATELLWARIKGSDESVLLQQYLQQSRLRLDTAELLVKHLADHSTSANFKRLRDSIHQALEHLYQRHREYSLQFIHSHPGTLAGLIAINQPFGRRQVFDPMNDSTLFLAFDSSLRRNYPRSKHTLFFHQRLADLQKKEVIKKIRLENLLPGKPLPDFRIASLDEGKWLSPDQFKGIPFLLIFWSPVEGKQIQNLIAIQRELKKNRKDLEVLCIAFDFQRTRWQNAVNNAGLSNWNHGSDLKGTASPLYELFLPDHRPLPHYIVVGAEGNITLTTSKTAEILQALKKL